MNAHRAARRGSREGRTGGPGPGRRPLRSTYPAEAAPPEQVRAILAATALVVAVGAAAYWNSLHNGFVFDDFPAILDNPTIRHVTSLGRVFSPPGGGSPVKGRPLVNLSLALNYALGGTSVFGYHVFNLAVHLLVALTFMAVLRRTIVRTAPGGTVSRSAVALSTAAALIWTVHPLATEAVGPIVNRSESLVGFFFLLTLYCVIAAAASRRPGRWYVLGITACALGMWTKEVMVTAPVVVLAYDSIFLSGSVRKALRLRRGFYIGLALTWLLLAYELVASGFSRGTSAGFGGWMTPWQYARTQCWAILHYLRLAVVPYPLVFDRGEWIASSAWEIVPGALAVGLLLVGTAVALRRTPRLGFLGIWFFCILAPTSVVPIPAQTVAEKRMYLPLMAVVAGAVLLADLGWRRLTVRWSEGGGAVRAARRMLPAAAVVIPVAAFGFLTHQRNSAFRDNLTIWEDTVARVPDNARAQDNLGAALIVAGRFAEAEEHLERAVALDSGFAGAYLNLALAQGQGGHLVAALRSAERSVELDPDDSTAETTLVDILARLGRWEQALAVAKAFVLRAPDDARANLLYGTVLERLGRRREGEVYVARARAIDPDVTVMTTARP